MSTKVMSAFSEGLRRLVREPLLQFLLLGLALFAISHALTAWRESGRQRIVIDMALVNYQRNLYHAQYGAWPDDVALEALLRAYVRDEALYREAVRLGLDSGDEVIRQRLVQKMEVLLTDAATAQDPDDATLQRFLRLHAQQYAVPARVSFDLLYFAEAPSASTQNSGETRARAALQRLQAGARAVQSDDFALGHHFDRIDADELQSRFGDSPMAGAPLQVPLLQWAGPFRSGFGWHLIRVDEREAPRAPDFATVRDRLAADWRAEMREQDRQQRIDALVKQHDVQRLDRQRR
jgi:hypothetical protein